MIAVIRFITAALIVVMCLTTACEALTNEIIITQVLTNFNTLLDKNYDVPNVDTDFKAFMDYRTITNRSSTQYSLQQLAYTDADGFRKIDDYYMIAVGTYYSDYCGKTFLIVLDTEIEFYAIVGDIKQDIHTDINNQYAGNGNVIEFIVDTRHIPTYCYQMGDMSYAGFEGQIEYILEVVCESEYTVS